MKKKRSKIWDKRYKNDKHHRKEPSKLLTKWISNLTKGKGLDVACGTGRNAIYMAKNGYNVDAIDFSEEALKIAKERADEEEVKVNWILSDLKEYEFPKEKYDLIIVSYFHPFEQINSIKESLKNNGFIIFEHHITADESLNHGPKNPKYKFEPNEILNKFPDFQVLDYKEGIALDDEKSQSAVARIMARKTNNPKKDLPKLNQ